MSAHDPQEQLKGSTERARSSASRGAHEGQIMGVGEGRSDDPQLIYDALEERISTHLRGRDLPAAPSIDQLLSPTRERPRRLRLFGAQLTFVLASLALAPLLLPIQGEHQSPRLTTEHLQREEMDPFSVTLPSDLFLELDMLSHLDEDESMLGENELWLTEPWFSEPL